MRSVNNGDWAVEKFVDSDFAVGKAASELGRLDLENKIIPAQGIITSNGSLLFDWKDKLEVLTTIRDKGGVLLSRRLDERFAVPGQERFEDVTIGIGNSFDAVEF